MLRCEAPRRSVKVQAFFMDRHEVTNREYHRFVTAQPEWKKSRIQPGYNNGSYLKHWNRDTFPAGSGDSPVVYVSWYAAMAYARWAGKRLPSETEWEYAARGGRQASEYPWGEEPPTERRANFAGSKTAGPVTVESYPPNGYGLYDMAGNVWEYCLDTWSCTNDAGTVQSGEGSAEWLLAHWPEVRSRRVIRGGSWGGAAVNLRVAYRDSHPPEGAGPHVGFRCVLRADAV